MAAHWYCLINGREHGPFTSDKIHRLATSGKLKRDDSVRPDTDFHWTPASAIPGLFPDASGHPVPPVAKAAPPKVARKRAAAPPQKNPPPVRAAAAAPVPQAIPLDPNSAAIPVAKPVAASVAAPVAAPVTDSGAQLPVAIPVAVPPATGMENRAAGAQPHRGKRKSQQLYVVVGGLAAVLVILGGVAVFVLGRGRGEKEPDVKIASAAESTEVNPATTDVDPETDPDFRAEAAQTSAAPKKLPAMPSLTKWLDATRQKSGLRGIVKLGISHVWLEPVEANGRVLNLNVDVTNLQSDQSLDFRGFNTVASQSVDTTVFVADSSGELLKNLPVRGASTDLAKRSLRMAPGELYTQQLSFAVENPESEHFRLALPYAALGHTGYLGFEIPRLMIKDRPPGEDEEGRATDEPVPADEPGAVTDRVRVEESPRTKAENDDVEPGAKPGDAEAVAPKRSGGQPETVSDLLRAIENSASKPVDGQDE